MAVAEGLMAAMSGALGYFVAKAVDAISWDPDPYRAGRHVINYGWPFVTKQMIGAVNGVYPYTYVSWLTFPESFTNNAAFYGGLSFALLNVVALGIYELHNWNKNRKTKS